MLSSVNTVAGRIASTIGSRKPVPTHAGSRIGHPGSRRPHRWVSASASTTTARSMATVALFNATTDGSSRKAGFRAPMVLPDSHSAFNVR